MHWDQFYCLPSDPRNPFAVCPMNEEPNPPDRFNGITVKFTGVERWAGKQILNDTGFAKFHSDTAIADKAGQIWRVDLVLGNNNQKQS